MTTKIQFLMGLRGTYGEKSFAGERADGKPVCANDQTEHVLGIGGEGLG
jgi:hypothetical protein